jgi:transcriptional regulator with XRE-family HTH domain
MNRFSITKLPSTIMQEIAVRHKLVRKSHNLSQAELAARSGVSLGSLKRFETTGQISFESLLKLAYFLDRLSDFDGVFLTENQDKIAKLFDKKR